MAEYKCGDCFYADLCEQSEMLVGFSRDNPAYCCMFLNSADVAPTIDAVEVVRCRDCKHYEIHKPKVLENCERNGYIIPMKPDDFCSYGERKDGDDNGCQREAGRAAD